MKKTLFLLAAVTASFAAAVSGAASATSPVVRLALPQPKYDGLFTVQLPVAHATLKPLLNTNSYAADVKIGRSVFRVDEPAWMDFAGDGTDVSNQTPLAAAQWIVKHSKGLHLNTADHGRRVEVFGAKRQLAVLTFQAEAAEMRTFEIALTHDGGDGQKLMRILDSSTTRFWLGQTDPRTVKSDPAGLALLRQVETAVKAQQHMSMTITPFIFFPSVRIDMNLADGYQGTFDDKGTLVGWQRGTESLQYQAAPDNCWDESSVDPVSPPSSSADDYGLKAGAPVQNGGQTTITFSSYSSNADQRPDEYTWTVDAATHLVVAEKIVSGSITDDKGQPYEMDATFDWISPVVEQSKPSGPICMKL